MNADVPIPARSRRGDEADGWRGRSSRHGKTGTFSFADGHAELHKWRDERTNPAWVHGWWEAHPPVWPAPGSQDFHWVYDRTTQWNPGWQ